MSGLLRGYLNNDSWQQTCAYANACGALVVSRHGCAPAMPSKEELDNYLSRVGDVPRPDKDLQLTHLHRVTTRDKSWQELCILAFDHRIQFTDMAREVGADLKRIPELKKLILSASQQVAQEANLEGKAGILCDGHFGQDVLNAVSGSGWWIGRPVEMPGSRPLELEHGNIGSQLVTWPKEHVVKCLVFFHPEDQHALRLEQEKQVREVYSACCQSGHEMLLEVVLPAGMPQEDDMYLRAIQRFYNLGVKPDWWKLPPLASQTWQQVEALIIERDAHCHGVVLLGLDAPEEELRRGFNQAAHSNLVKGFAVGRTIFGLPSKAWLAGELNDGELIAQIKHNYHNLIRLWRARG